MQKAKDSEALFKASLVSKVDYRMCSALRVLVVGCCTGVGPVGLPCSLLGVWGDIAVGALLVTDTSQCEYNAVRRRTDSGSLQARLEPRLQGCSAPRALVFWCGLGLSMPRP